MIIEIQNATIIGDVVFKILYLILSWIAIKYYSEFCSKTNRSYNNVILLAVISIILIIFRISFVFNIGCN